MKLKLHVLLSIVGISLLSLSAFAFSIQNKTIAAGKPLVIAGSVFFDANNNGVRDSKENDLVTRAANEPFSVEIYNSNGDFLSAVANADNEWVIQSTVDFPIVAGQNYVMFVYSFNDASVGVLNKLFPTTQNVGDNDSIDSDFTSGFHCGSNGGVLYKGKLNFDPANIEDLLNLNLGLIDGAKIVNGDQCNPTSSSSSSSSSVVVSSSSSSSLANCTVGQLVYNNQTPLCNCDLTTGVYQLGETTSGVICQLVAVSSSSSLSSSLQSVSSVSSTSTASSIGSVVSSASSAVSSLDPVSSSSTSNSTGVLSFVSSTSSASNKTGVLSFVSSATNNASGVLSSTGFNIILLVIGAIAISLCGIVIMFITRMN
jgi:hypothetical protein